MEVRRLKKKQQKTILKTQLAFKSHFKYDEKKRNA